MIVKITDAVRVLVLTIVALACAPLAAFAQTGPTVTPLVTGEQFEGLIDSFVAALGPILLVVIGAAFGISIVVMVVRWIGRLLFRAK